MSVKQLKLLLNAVRDLDNLLIVPHNNPDPDAIASALGLQYLLSQTQELSSQVVYKGIIGRAENRALVAYLNGRLSRLRNTHLQEAAAIALIDTQPGAGNHPLSPDTEIAVVLDHHPWRPETDQVSFYDVRPDVGAAATIVTEYIRAAGLELPSTLATALFYGIKTDTSSLGRNTSQADVDAYLYLQPQIDTVALAGIERAQVPPVYFKSFDAALQAARIYDDVIVAYIGPLTYPDLVAEMADLLLRLENVNWAICSGIFNAQLYIAVRTLEEGAGKLARSIINGRGTAGGHGTLAGGQIPLDGSEPDKMARELSRKALRHLNKPPDLSGKPLV